MIKDFIEENGVKVGYSKGHFEKASLTHKRLSEMKDFFLDEKNIDIKISVDLLDRDSWNDEFKDEIPYGLPFVMSSEENGGSARIVVPATEDGIIVESTLIFKDMLPDSAKDIFDSINYNYEDAIKVFPDLIGYHEVGHTVLWEGEVTGLNHWFNEFMATYCAFAYMIEKEPALAKLWIGNAYITYLDGSEPQLTSLEDFDTAYCSMHPANYDWYQKKFALLADKVYKEMGLDFFDKVMESFKGVQVTSDETFKKLKEITPLFEEWII